MNIIKDLYSNIVGKKVKIMTKGFGPNAFNTYKGTVVACYSTGETFIALDTNELININYIEVITILK